MSTPNQPGKDEKPQSSAASSTPPQRQGPTDGPDTESASPRPDASKGRPPLPPLPPRQGSGADAPRPTDASGQQSVRGTQVPPWQRGPNAQGNQQGAGAQDARAAAPPSQQREPQTNLKRPEGPTSGPAAAQQAPKQAPAQSPADRKPAAPQSSGTQNSGTQGSAAATPPAGQKPAGSQAPAGRPGQAPAGAQPPAGAQAPAAKQSPGAKQAPAGKPGQAPTGATQRPAPSQGGTARKAAPPRPAPPQKGAQSPSAPPAGGQKPAQQREAAKAKAAGIDGPTRHIDRKSLPKDMPDLSEAKHPLPAASSSTGQQPKIAATATPQRVAAAEGEPLRASVQIRKIDPWSMLKISSLISVSLFFVWMVAVGLLYLVLDGMGVWDRLNSAFTDIVSASGSADGLVTAGQVFGYSAVIGLVNMVLFTALATIGSFIYNTCSDLVGGLEVTLADRD